MKILVTGSAGFIGRHLVRRLLSEGHEVIGFDVRARALGTTTFRGDIASFNFDEILDGVDVVFHLASLLGTAELFHRIVEAERVNVLGTLNLLEAMRRKNVNKIVFTSKPNIWKYNPYTITKDTCERYLEMYRHVYGFESIIVKPYNIYGPAEDLAEYRKAVPYFVLAAVKGEPLEIFGDGEQTLDPIYVDDAIEALERCAKVAPKEIVEIGNSKPVKVVQLAEKVLELTNSPSKIVHIPMRRGEGQTGELCASGNMKHLLDFSPNISLDEGLRRTIKWYSKNLDDFSCIYKLKPEDCANHNHE